MAAAPVPLRLELGTVPLLYLPSLNFILPGWILASYHRCEGVLRELPWIPPPQLFPRLSL